MDISDNRHRYMADLVAWCGSHACLLLHNGFDSFVIGQAKQVGVDQTYLWAEHLQTPMSLNLPSFARPCLSSLWQTASSPKLYC